MAVPRNLFVEILRRIEELRPRSTPAWAERIDGKEKATEGVSLEGEKLDRMDFGTRPNYQNRTSGRLRTGNHYNGGAIWV